MMSVMSGRENPAKTRRKHADTNPDDVISNVRRRPNVRSNVSQIPLRKAASADTANTANIYGRNPAEPLSTDLRPGEAATLEELRAHREGRLSSQDVRELFAKPPGWLRDQTEHCRRQAGSGEPREGPCGVGGIRAL